MIFTSSPQSVADSRRFSPGEHIPRLAECDRVHTYSECGYFCVAGYRGDSRTVHVHMDRPDGFGAALAGYGYRMGHDRLERLTEEERREARAAAKSRHWYGRG